MAAVDKKLVAQDSPRPPLLLYYYHHQHRRIYKSALAMYVGRTKSDRIQWRKKRRNKRERTDASAYISLTLFFHGFFFFGDSSTPSQWVGLETISSARPVPLKRALRCLPVHSVEAWISHGFESQLSLLCCAGLLLEHGEMLMAERMRMCQIKIQ